ncbi:hypothetical protein [Nonomuraea helvata]|uniref:Uncharacterized protein n=1 Tax=Nonomuraea helvata TaxID=37484 RepID=A0ABV5RSX3_9ACTN
MPNLKSVMAGLAFSTLLTGGVVGLGATSADAFTGTILSDDDDNDRIFFDNDDDDDDDDNNFAEFLPFFANNGFNNGNNGFFGGRRCGRGGGGGGWKSNRRHVCVTVFNDNQNFNFDHKRDKRREFENDHREVKFKKKHHDED